MAQALGNVLKDTEGPRGPDVELKIEVPEAWLKERAHVEVELPRNLPCASCGGGGCDTCHRAGAVSLRERNTEPEILSVALPPLDAGGRNQCLRIPERGGPAEDPDQPRGHLFLTVSTADQPTELVTRVARSYSSRQLGPEEQKKLMQRSLLMAVGLCISFVLLLYLSGWL